MDNFVQCYSFAFSSQQGKAILLKTNILYDLFL